MTLNLKTGIACRGLKNYQVAQQVGMSESRLSRLVTCRDEALPHERARISKLLNLDEAWLFRAIVPPARQSVAVHGQDDVEPVAFGLP